jgi:hypothetical protein
MTESCDRRENKEIMHVWTFGPSMLKSPGRSPAWWVLRFLLPGLFRVKLMKISSKSGIATNSNALKYEEGVQYANALLQRSTG